MKKTVIAILLISTLLLTACNAMEKPEAGDADDKEALNFEASDANILEKDKFKLTVDMIKYTTDSDYPYANVKTHDETAKNAMVVKQIANQKQTIQKAPGQKSTLIYCQTIKIPYSFGFNRSYFVDIYNDPSDPKYEYWFHNDNGQYIGNNVRGDYLAKTFNEAKSEPLLKSEEEFESKALTAISSFVDISEYELVDAEFSRDIATGEIKGYERWYIKKINGISTAEHAYCKVFADGTPICQVYERDRYKNITIPDINTVELLPLSAEKVKDIIDNIPDSYKIDHFEILDKMFIINPLGQLELCYHFSFTAYPTDYNPSDTDRPTTSFLSDGFGMAIVFD